MAAPMTAIQKRELLKQKQKQKVKVSAQTETLRYALRFAPDDLEVATSEIEKELEEFMSGIPKRKGSISETRSIYSLDKRNALLRNSLKRSSLGSDALASQGTAPNQGDTAPQGTISASELYLSKTVSADLYGNPATPRRFAGGSNRTSARISNLIDLSITKAKTAIPVHGSGITSATLIDYAFLVGPAVADLDFSAQLEASTELHNLVHPQMLYFERSLMNADLDIDILPYFCFPSGIDLVGQRDPAGDDVDGSVSSNAQVRYLRCEDPDAASLHSKKRSQVFTYTLQNHTSNHYGICMVVPRTFRDTRLGLLITTNYCICLVTEYPYVSFLCHILQKFDACGGFELDSAIEEQADGLLVRPDLKVFSQLISRLKKQTVPGMGQLIDFNVSVRDARLTFSMVRMYGGTGKGDRALEKDLEVCYHTMLWALPILLNCFPLDQILLAIGCALTEMRILVVSPYLQEVSACILALINLLRPLKWPGTVIVSCPEVYISDFVGSPVFFLLGAQRLPPNFEHTRGIVILDTQAKTVILHNDDVVTANTLTMPQSTKLSKALRPHHSLIKSSFAAAVPPSVAGWDEYDADSSVARYPELNMSSESGQSLRSAVGSFCSTINKHITTVINTSVAQDNEIKQNMNSKRKPRPQSSRLRVNSDASGHDLSPLDTNFPVTGTVFSAKDLGAHGIVFLKRFLDTQMYSVYCVNMFTHLAEAKASDSSNSPKALSMRSEKSEVGRPFEYADPAVVLEPKAQLYALLLSGTMPVSQTELESVRETYAAGYMPNHYALSSDRNAIPYDGTGYVCSGNCEGKANTPECTPLCVQLWTDKVSTLRHQMYLKTIISQHCAHEIILHDIVMPDGRVLFVKPRMNPIKHTRETSSQYEKRKKDVLMIDKERILNERRKVHNSRQYAQVVVKWHGKKTKMIQQSNRRITEREALRQLHHSSAIFIQAHYRRYLIRKNIVSLVLELLDARRQRFAQRLVQLIDKATLKSLAVAKKKHDLRRFVSTPRSSSLPEMLYGEFGNDMDASSKSLDFVPLSSHALRKNNRPFESSSAKDEEVASVGSASSGSRFNFRGSIKTLSTIKEFLGLHSKKERQHSFSSNPAPLLEEHESEDDTPPHPVPQKRSSKDMIMGSPKLVWRSMQRTLSFHTRSPEDKLFATDSPNLSPIQSQSEKVSTMSPLGPSLKKMASADDMLNVSFDGSESPEPSLYPLPLRSMDRAVFKVLVEQQRTILVEMWKLLRRGIRVFKHSRSGRPKLKYLFCDVDMKKLFWRSSDKDKPNPVANEDHAEGEEERQKERRNSLATARTSRRSSLSFVPRQDADRKILFEEITQTFDSVETEVMRNSLEKGYIGNGFILSIVTKDRTLDIEVDGNIYTLLNNGFKIYVEFLTKVRESPASSMPEPGPESVVSSCGEDNFPLVVGSGDAQDISVIVGSSSPQQSIKRLNSRLYSTYSTLAENVNFDSIPLPIRSMHPAVFRLLVAQQRQLLVDLWKLLREGLQILKHSKSNRPKIRYLFCDIDMKKLYWRSSNKVKPSPSTAEDGSEGERERDKERQESAKSALRRKSRRSSVSFGPRVDADREIYFEEITEVYDTIVTDVMKNSQAKGYVNSTDLGFLCSITTPTRTLDFEIDEVYFGIFNHGIRIMVDFLKNIPRSGLSVEA